jgi:hypothetical protein
MSMAASSASVLAIVVGLPETGLRPEPQGACTLAATAALKIGAEARSRASYGNSVFDRHSTQSLIAAALRRELGKFKELPVDRTVYREASPVDESQAARRQVPEYSALWMYTVRTAPESFRRP